MDGKAMKYIATGILLIIIGSVSMSLIGTALWNGICLLFGAIDAGYGAYLAIK